MSDAIANLNVDADAAIRILKESIWKQHVPKKISGGGKFVLFILMISSYFHPHITITCIKRGKPQA